MSILTEAKRIARSKKEVQKKERAESEKSARETEKLSRRIEREIKKLVNGLKGKKIKRKQVLIDEPEHFREICSVSLKGAKGYSDEWLFTIEHDQWVEESLYEGCGDIHCKGIQIRYYDHTARWREEHRKSTRMSFSDYTFNKDIQVVEGWLIGYIANLV